MKTAFEWISPLVVAFLFQSFLLAGLALTVAALTSRLGVRFRIAVFRCAILSTVALACFGPFLRSMVSPQWQVSRTATVSVFGKHIQPIRQRQSSIGPASNGTNSNFDAHDRSRQVNSDHSSSNGEIQTHLPATTVSLTQISTFDGVALAWLLGACYLICTILAGYIWILRLRLSSNHVEDGLTASVLKKQLSAQNVGQIQLAASKKVGSAFVAGMTRPVIYLPDGIEHDFNVEQIEAILCHEIVHVRQGDCTWSLLARLCCALSWPNPLMWLVARKMILASEELCDQLVLGTGIEASTYAGCLLRVAEATNSSLPNRLVGAGVYSSKSQLFRRISLVLKNQPQSSMKSTRNLTLKLAGIALVSVIGASLLVSAAPLKSARHDTTPEATMQAIVEAINRNDWNGVFSRIEGAKVDAAVAKFKKVIAEQKSVLRVTAQFGPFTTTNDTSTVHVKIEYKETEAKSTRTTSIDEDVKLHRQDGDWKLAGRTKKIGFLGTIAELGRRPETMVRARATARFSVIESNIRQIAMAVCLYLNDHNNKLSLTSVGLKASLRPYITNDSIWQDPNGRALDVQFNAALNGRSTSSITDAANCVMLSLGPKGSLIFNDGETPVAFVDGHVTMIRRARVASLSWQ